VGLSALLAIAALAVLAAAARAGTAGPVAVRASDGCPPPRVDIFDLAIPADPVGPGPVVQGSPQAAQYLTWLDLTTASGGVSDALLNHDPGRDGIEYLDATIAQASNGHGTVLHYNPGFDTAPPGPVPIVDYLVSGQITGSQGAYTVTVSLQDATTRAQVASGSATFADSSDSMDAARRAASQLTPVLAKIRAYQRRLKDQSNEMAISPPLDQPAVTPARRHLRVGQATDVSLALRDCDGQPLAHRTLKLRATHGRISPALVKTDRSGRAHAMFTATSSGLARLRADYGPYETAVHRRDQRRGVAAIAVRSSGLWELRIDGSYQQTDSGHATDGRNYSSASGTVSAGVSAIEWIRGAHPLSAGRSGGFDVLGGRAQAGYSDTQSETDIALYANGQRCVTTIAAFGARASRLPGLDMSTGGRRPKLQIDFAVTASEHQTYHCAPFDDNSGNTTTTSTFGVTLQNVAGWQGSCNRTGDARWGYTIACNVHTSHLTGEALGNRNIAGSQVGELTITLTPL
jgi:hypothetical protein